MTRSPAATGGELVLVSTPIGNIGDISARALGVLGAADIVCCEDTRHTGLLLKRLGVTARRLLSLNAHNEAERASYLLRELASGSTVAVVSDAGTPGVSDPGERLVAIAIEAGFRVTAVPGASAVLAALVVSGMGVSRWRFEGFLPRKGVERRRILGEIAAAPCPSVCFESPHRLAATLSDLAEVCGGERAVAVCRELTKLHEEVLRSSLTEAAERFAATPTKGEIVVVVAGAPAPERPSAVAADLKAEVDSLVSGGMTRRDAVRAVAARRALPRSEVYAAAIE